jgi:hypothetical protein
MAADKALQILLPRPGGTLTQPISREAMLASGQDTTAIATTVAAMTIKKTDNFDTDIRMWR